MYIIVGNIFEVELPRICLYSCRTSLTRKPGHRCAMMLPTAAAVTTIHPNKATLHPWLLKAGAPAAEGFFRELLSSIVHFKVEISGRNWQSPGYMPAWKMHGNYTFLDPTFGRWVS